MTPCFISESVQPAALPHFLLTFQIIWTEKGDKHDYQYNRDFSKVLDARLFFILTFLSAVRLLLSDATLHSHCCEFIGFASQCFVSPWLAGLITLEWLLEIF